MKIKLFIAAGIIIGIYILVFSLSEITQTTVQEKNIYAIIPQCENSGNVVGIDQDNNSYCTYETSIKKQIQDKSITLLAWKEKEPPDFLFAASDTIVIQKNQNVTFYRVNTSDNTLAQIGVIPLSDHETLSSAKVFSEKEYFVFYLSFIREVDTPEKNKTVIKRIVLANSSLIDTKSIELQHMERVIRIFHLSSQQEIIVTGPVFDFVQPTYSVLLFTDTLNHVDTACSIDSINPSRKIPLIHITQCKQHTAQWLTIEDAVVHEVTEPKENASQLFESNDFSINLKEQLIISGNFEPLEFPKEAFSLRSLELITVSSTTIGKRVYNCSDLGESLQISLRVCIRNHE